MYFFLSMHRLKYHSLLWTFNNVIQTHKKIVFLDYNVLIKILLILYISRIIYIYEFIFFCPHFHLNEQLFKTFSNTVFRSEDVIIYLGSNFMFQLYITVIKLLFHCSLCTFFLHNHRESVSICKYQKILAI